MQVQEQVADLGVDRRENQEAGITIQDALLNGVITLFVLGVLIAVFFMVRGQFKATNAQSEVVALVNGIRSANGGNPNYSALTGAAIQTAGGVPSDMSASGTTAGAGTFSASWAPAGITADFTNGGTNSGFSLKFTADSSGTCTQVLNAEVGDSSTVSAGGTTVATAGAYAAGQSAAVACNNNPQLVLAFN